MADTDTETLPNGTGPLSNEEEDERLKQRPADIDADVREMERRKRVEALMSSKLFREELERVLDQQMHEGNDAPLLQRIKEMVGGRLHTGSIRGPSCVLPINDIRGIEGIGYEKGEKILRCKLAAVYRLVDLFGWTQTGITGQITARLNTAVEQVLTTPRGLLPHEVTASSLVKVDMQGVVQDQGTTNFPVNVEGFSLHASVHAARPDVRCVLHVRSPSALAVSATRRGLLPLCNEAALLGDIAYHHVPHGVLDNEERDKLVRALGPHAKVLMVTSSGALCCGATLEEAFHAARNLVAACDVQLRLASIPLDDLILIDEDTRRQIYESSRKPPAEGGKWRVGGEEFEALMRMLDNAGFRTGYIYRHPLIKNDVPKPKNDVEVPPAVSSLGYLLEEEELYKQGVWKKGQGKTGERTRWLNSPNVYQKVEVLETGTSDPKKITKWIQDGSPGHSSTPLKIHTLQFVPKNTNPKEFKQLQQQIKENRRADKISAGPQSHILEGVTWDEANKAVGEDAVNTHTGDHVVLMGAASKGIIQRGYQHNATVYSAPYARNPFDHITDNEIDEYKRDVERKRRGNDYDTDLSESEAISAAQITSPASAPSETEEESRDEHRVLRIETKQAPVRSQPEVVLSDVDTTDFLNAEREHADRTKSKLTQTHALTEAMPSNKKSMHDYSRVKNFDNILRRYELNSDANHPKCKMNLNSKLDNNNAISSSRSSLYSIPSIDWDGRCKSEYGFRTRSLPRRKVETSGRLYRTRSYSGFVNAYIQNPIPTHYHIPRFRSFSSSTNANVCDQYQDDKKGNKIAAENSAYFSVDNISQKSDGEAKESYGVVKVKENIVPVYKVGNIDQEFVYSQEFNEDNYFGDISSGFASEDKAIVDKGSLSNEFNMTVMRETKSDTDKHNGGTEAVTEGTEDIDNTFESTEGEYHSFTDDFEEAYESPVKELVEKDIRDYSVPINFYCEDYTKKESPKKSPLKTLLKVLEPILEESKSSYGDESSNNSQNEKDMRNSDTYEVRCVNEVILDPVTIETNKLYNNLIENIKDHNLELSTFQVTEQAEDVKYEVTKSTDPPETLQLGKAIDAAKDQRPNSTEFSLTSSQNDVLSFNSTAEFEKYEVISDVLVSILNKINYETVDLVWKKNLADGKFSFDDKLKEEYLGSFSITKIILDIEENMQLNESVISESSNNEPIQSYKIVESILYYLFDRVLYISLNKLKGKTIKKAVKFVDCGDIFSTAINIWSNPDGYEDYSVVDSEFVDCSDVKDLVESNLDSSHMENGKYNIKNGISVEDIKSAELLLIGEYCNGCDKSDPIVVTDLDHCGLKDMDIIVTLDKDELTNFDGDNETSLNAPLEDDGEMDVAFLEDESQFEGNISNNETPNKKAYDDLSVLYENDNSILGSPFVKPASVLSMSQTEHTGGIKYWISFDDNANDIDKTIPRTVRRGKDIPSFLTFDLNDSLEHTPKTGSKGLVGHKDASTTDTDYAKVTDMRKHSIDSNETFDCNENVNDSRNRNMYELQRKSSSRLHTSWPPYEDGLFYRIISRFRMTESFDLSQVDALRNNNNSF